MRSISALAQQNIVPTATGSSTPGKDEKRSGSASDTGKRIYSFPENDPFSLFPFVQPEQFFAEQRSVLQRTGEYRLLVAVLQDALECWFRHRNSQRIRGQRLFRETKEWFSSHDRNRLFAFECICDHLALDPNHIRRSLLQWQSSHSHRSVPRFYLTPVINSRTQLGYNGSRTKRTRNRVWEK